MHWTSLWLVGWFAQLAQHRSLRGLNCGIHGKYVIYACLHACMHVCMYVRNLFTVLLKRANHGTIAYLDLFRLGGAGGAGGAGGGRLLASLVVRSNWLIERPRQRHLSRRAQLCNRNRPSLRRTRCLRVPTNLLALRASFYRRLRGWN